MINRIPAPFLTQEARDVFDGKDKSIKIDPRLIRWFNDVTLSECSLLLGPTGCGKTLAAAMAASVAYQWIIQSRGSQFQLVVAKTKPAGGELRNVKAVRWVRADKLSRMLSSSDMKSEFDSMITAPLLVIDEMGYDRFPETILEVIGTRSELRRPIIATSGKKYSELAEKYSDATMRRLSGGKTGILVDCFEPLPNGRVVIAPCWPVAPSVARQNDAVATGGRSDSKDAPVANREAMARITELLGKL
jgi:hypothetical protein